MPRAGPALDSLVGAHAVLESVERAFRTFFDHSTTLATWRDLQGALATDFAGNRFRVAYASVEVEFRLQMGLGPDDRAIGVVSAWMVNEAPAIDHPPPLLAFGLETTGRVIPGPGWRDGGRYITHEQDAVEIAAAGLAMAMRQAYSIVKRTGQSLPVPSL